MPYSKNPTISTYDTKRISFIANPQQRSGALPNKDFRLVNMMTEIISSPLSEGKKYHVKSRPGLTKAYTINSGEARGIYYWSHGTSKEVFSVVGSSVYVNGVFLNSLTTSTGMVGFTEYVNSTGIVSLILVDGINGYIYVNGTTAPNAINPANWTATTSLVVDNTRSPTINNDYFYRVTTGGITSGTEPVWHTKWLATTTYTTTTYKAPTTPNGFYYEVTTAGTTGATEPIWPLVLGSTITDGTVVWTCRVGTITDGTVVWSYFASSFPTPHIASPIFLDGYLFLAKANTQDVYNSNLDDPLVWTAGEYCSAEMYPDSIKALTKNNNYLYAIGSNSIEYLYDAGIATGSPLARQASAVQQFGTLAPNTVVQTEKEVVLVGGTANGGPTVWIIDGFKETEIGIPAIKGMLLVEGISLSNATAYCIRVSGQKLYIINLTSRTLVYSFDTKMWSEWSSGVTSTLSFIGIFASDGPNGTPYILNKTGTSIYLMSEEVFLDDTTAFRCEIVTAKLDFDMINRKFMSRLSLIGDIPDATGIDNSITIDWSDDDYITWSSARTITFNYDFPILKQLGVFRRRAFRFRYSSPHLLRLEGFEVDINKGSQ